MKYLPKEARFEVWINDNKVFSRMQEGHVNFFEEIEKIISSYMKMARKCDNCKEYYFCDHEDRKELASKQLKSIYNSIITEYGLIKVGNTLYNINQTYPLKTCENLLISGLISYLIAIKALNQTDNEIDIQLYKKINKRLIDLYYDKLRGNEYD